MGAEQFENIVKIENDISHAFADAAEAMAYAYGHAGYTGTLAEKDRFTIVGNVETQDEAEALAKKLFDEDDKRISDKWGPAGAITFKDIDGSPMVLFFGWASS